MSITEKLAAEMRKAAREEGEPPRIIPNCLLVEDDKADAELSIHALCAMGAEVVHAMTGDQAIELLNKSKDPLKPDFHIVFLDLNLTGSAAQGLQVLQHIRTKFPSVHVVIVSGYIDEGILNLIASQKCGYVGIIRKPLEKMDVAEILAKHRLDQ